MIKHGTTETDQHDENLDVLFKEYLGICNEAIRQHKNEFPYKEVLNVSEALLGERPVDIAVYDDEPKASYSIKFRDKKLENGGQPDDVKKAWRVNLSYLRKVVEHPEEYIKHPERLDLDWLKSRLNIL